MRFDILTLFPDAVDAMMQSSILGRAQKKGLLEIHAHQIRDYTTNRQNQVDDYPYGGGRGAILQCDPLYRCWCAVCDDVGAPVHTIFLSACGSICQGVKVSSEVLTTRTSQLPGISLEAPKHVIGRNTIECMQSGIMLGAACMIDGMIERMEEELGVKATVVATGGISRFVLPMCRSEIRYDRDLLLRGLRILYEKNKR